jgi:hypothetical protein
MVRWLARAPDVAARRRAARQRRGTTWSATCLVAVLITVSSPINAAGAFLKVGTGEKSGGLGAWPGLRVVAGARGSHWKNERNFPHGKHDGGV